MGENAEGEGEQALGQLRAFVGFLRGTWGILAGLTSLFPLSNSLLGALPLAPGAENLSSVLATIFSLFVILFIFASRKELANRYWSRIPRISALVFIAATVLLYAYLVQFPLPPSVSRPELPIIFALTFSLYTASFAMLALREYTRDVMEKLEEDIRRLEGRHVYFIGGGSAFVQKDFPEFAVERALRDFERELLEKDQFVWIKRTRIVPHEGEEWLQMFMEVKHSEHPFRAGYITPILIDRDGRIREKG